MFTWDAAGEPSGKRLKARLFDGDAAQGLDDGVARTLYFLRDTSAHLQWTEQDRRNLHWGFVVAQSYGVYAFGDRQLNIGAQVARRTAHSTTGLDS